MLRTKFRTLNFFFGSISFLPLSLTSALLDFNFISSSLGSTTVSSVVCTEVSSGWVSGSFPPFSLTSFILLFLIILCFSVAVGSPICIDFQRLNFLVTGFLSFIHLLRINNILSLFFSGLSLNTFFSFLTSKDFADSASFSFSLSLSLFSSSCNFGNNLLDLLALCFEALLFVPNSIFVKFLLDLLASANFIILSDNNLFPAKDTEGLLARLIFLLNSSFDSFFAPPAFSAKIFLLLSLIKNIFFFLTKLDLVSVFVVNIFFPFHHL